MPEPRELPKKLYFRIGEVAGLVGVEPHVLRYWEREFRSIRPRKSAKGQRVYSRKDVENLLRVKDLLYRDGFTIAGAKKQMTGSPGDTAESAEPITVKDKLVALRTEVERFLSELEPSTALVPAGRAGGPALKPGDR